MKMKNIITLILLAGFIVPKLGYAQEKTSKDEKTETFKFDTIAIVKTTPVKNQAMSGTCWSFATTSFVETEILRLTGKELDLSEMFSVYYAYVSKAISYVRLHGLANFGPGGQAHDVIDVIREHGIAPEKDYSGLNYGTEKHNHGELNEVLTDFIKGVVKNKNHKLTPVWSLAFVDILNVYLGEPPAKVNFEDKELSPIELRDKLKFNPDDYVELTSYTHHPFYTQFRLEIPDNWSFNSGYYNLPIDELQEVMDNALKNGFSVCWDGDVSDKGFSYRKAIAIEPVTKKEELQGTDMSRWQKLSDDDLKDMAYKFEGPVPERIISQADRQNAFDNYSTTDDHLMHLTGMLKDQNGTVYYITKNSWGADSNKNDGYLNMSSAFIRLNTVAIMVHKDAIPASIRKKLNL